MITPPSQLLSLSTSLPPGVFALMNAYTILKYLQLHLTGKQFRTLFFFGAIISAGVVFVAVVGLTYLGYIAPWSGRFYSLYDTGYNLYCSMCVWHSA